MRAGLAQGNTVYVTIPQQRNRFDQAWQAINVLAMFPATI
jgi:hypothetical protein